MKSILCSFQQICSATQRWGAEVPGPLFKGPVSTPRKNPMVSVDVKQHSTNTEKVRAQELCERRGGRPGLPSLINLRFLWT